MKRPKRYKESLRQAQQGAPEQEHLPDWKEVFDNLRDEAEELYPDGRLRVILPEKKQQKGRGRGREL